MESAIDLVATLDAPTEGRHEMAVLDKSGDTKIIWNPQNDAEVEAAKTTFDTLKSKGYLAYSVKTGGDKGEIVREFDRYAEKLVLAPPMAGG